MKFTNISTTEMEEPSWDKKTYPVLMVNKPGGESEMVVLFLSERKGVVVAAKPLADQRDGWFAETWTPATDDIWTYLPETQVIVLSNKEEED